MALRIRITVFGGSRPSDPSGKVNFMNARGVVAFAAALSGMSLAPGSDAAGDVAARNRPKGKTQPQMPIKRLMDTCSQLTQVTGYPEGAAAIMLALHDDAKREYALGLPKSLPIAGIFRPGQKEGVDSHQHDGRLEAPETLWPDMAKGPTYLSVKNGAFSTSGMGHLLTSGSANSTSVTFAKDPADAGPFVFQNKGCEARQAALA
jgi:hypothetical protein